MPFEEQKKSGESIKKGVTTIKADLVKASKSDKSDCAELTGNVEITRKYDNGEYFFVAAEKCVYENKNINFTGVKKMQTFSLQENTTYYLYCDQLTWNLDDQKGFATGKPLRFEKEGQEYIVTSNIAYFDKLKQEVLFTKNPIAKQKDKEGDGIYKAEKILYYLNTKIMKMLGDVDIDFLSKEKKKDNSIQQPKR
jgi:hypothetical protein